MIQQWRDLSATEFCELCRDLRSGYCVLEEKRHRMIAEAAYFRAQNRGFQNGNPQQDWLEAEQEINQSYFLPTAGLSHPPAFSNEIRPG
jgi:hypothetical protein